jgi:pyruvate dehydrogenase (quinone)
MAKKIAEQLVKMLVHAGIERIYAVADDSIYELNNAVRCNCQIHLF